MNILELSEQEIFRRRSLEELRALGINPYPAEEYVVTAYAREILDTFEDDTPRRSVRVAGRVMGRRIMGKASFLELQDSTGRIQIYITRDEICPGEDKALYNNVVKKLMDIGDFIGIEGEVFRTQMGEISVHASSLTFLSKALRPLPVVKEKDGQTFDSFTDPELRFRQRYVDLVVNSHVKNIFLKRTKIFNAMRQFFNERGYIEVDTPVLQPIPGGAAARPFITHHNALDIPLYLRIANELYLKRLTERMLEFICLEVLGTTKVRVGDREIDFKAPFKRITMLDAIHEHTGIDISQMGEDELRATCKQLGIEVDESMGIGKMIDEIFGEKCEGSYIHPTFITDYPKEMSPLTKEHRSNPRLTERFELMVNGKELANAYSELNDPIDQRERFEEQLRLSEKGDDEAMFIDADFLRALEYGMPPTSGMGIGMDRLVMLLTGQESIQEVLFFPQMRPEKVAPRDKKEVFIAAGIPEEWVPVLHKAGYLTLEAVRAEEKPGRLLQQLQDIKKKYQLELEPLTLEIVTAWTTIGGVQ